MPSYRSVKCDHQCNTNHKMAVVMVAGVGGLAATDNVALTATAAAQSSIGGRAAVLGSLKYKFFPLHPSSLIPAPPLSFQEALDLRVQVHKQIPKELNY